MKIMMVKRSSLLYRIIRICFSFILIFGLVVPAVSPPVLVYAAFSGATLKGLIFGLSAMMGVGNIDATSLSNMSNNAVLNAPLTAEYFGEGGVYSAADIDAALSSYEGVARWSSGFANTADQARVAQQYITSAGGDAGALDGVGGATAGENILSSARHYIKQYGETGIEDVRPALGGQTMTDALNATCVMASLADVGYNFDNFIWYAHEAGLSQEEIDACFDSGAAFGNLENAKDYLQNRDKTIVNGIDINTNDDVMQYVTGKSIIYSYYWPNEADQLAIRNLPNSDIACFAYPDTGDYYYIKYVNRSNTNSYNVTGITKNGSGRIYNFSLTVSKNSSNSERLHIRGNIKNAYITTSSEISNIERNFRNGVDYNTEEKSPSFIGNDGQLSGTASQNGNTYNYNINVTPQTYNNNYHYSVPTDEEINTFVESANTAIEQQLPQEDISDIYDNLIENLRYEYQEPVPTAPPVVPDQPVPNPKPTITPEQEAENTEIMATGSLKDKFPFCIPWDIFLLISGWEDIDREAPHLHFELDLGPAGVHEIDIDFSAWDDIAALLRTLELILFVIGLMIMTRRLIGAGG